MIKNTPKLNDFVKRDYDHVTVSFNAGTYTETFTFKTGGASGETVGTVIIVYTDATKAQLATVDATWI